MCFGPCARAQTQLNETKGRIDQMTAQLNTAIAQAGIVGQLTNATAAASATLNTLNMTLFNAASLLDINQTVANLSATQGKRCSCSKVDDLTASQWKRGPRRVVLALALRAVVSSP